VKFRALKYTAAFLLPITTFVSFTCDGLWTFLPVAFSFGLIPALELFIPAKRTNTISISVVLREKDPLYDAVLYSTVIIQWAFLCWFLFTIGNTSTSVLELVGRITGMGLMCGVLGINVAHELGHRRKEIEQKMSQAMLLSSLYMHFFIEHNQGHHRNVGTNEDPGTARPGEPIYLFWPRTLITSYVSAWSIQTQSLKRAGKSFFSLQNTMLGFQLIQLGLMCLIIVFFGYWVAIYFVVAALIGALLLETVNYIEHYGLQRHKVNENRYADVAPRHSWNSDHLLGRLVLFELTRHSDHHANSHKKYQLLDSIKDAPQLPTGYPGMMLLSLVPPLWFRIVDPLIDKNFTDE
jgi:alkane 1-monooxygenase